VSDLNPVIQAAPTLLSGATGSSWLLGASGKLGVGTWMASIVGLDDQRALNRDAMQYAVGYVHPWSKRTSLYTAFARIVNSNGGTLTVNTPSYPGAGELQAQFGISHSF
jgi:GBP family porin